MIKAHLFIPKDGIYAAVSMDAGADIHSYSLKKRSYDTQFFSEILRGLV
ncbi:hypothetical protein [Pelagibaculum spongiae]|nr:hypothetical protein [Pelagibaculum spongiae]